MKENLITHYLDLPDDDYSEDFSVRKIINELTSAYKSLSKGKDFEYQGFDLTESSLLCAISPVKERLTLDYIEGGKENQDESLLSVLLGCALNLGYDAGIKSGRIKGQRDLLSKLINTNESL